MSLQSTRNSTPAYRPTRRSVLNALRSAALTAVAGAVLATLGAPAAHADQLERVKERGKLIAGIRNDYVPFGYTDENGKLVGFEVELAKAVAKDIFGSEDAIEFVPVVASNRIEFLNAGRIDVIFATLGVTEDRGKVIDFTDYYYMMAGMVLMAPKDAEYASWDDIKGKRICGSQGNLYNRMLTEKLGAELVLFSGTAEIYNAFETGRCDAIAYDGPNLNMKVSEDGWKDKYKIALDTIDYVPIAGGVRKNEPEFLAAVNAGINKAEAAGLLVEGEEKYNLGKSDYVAKRAEEAKSKM
ncbi:MAG: ABC transporter substrate-binding protein [Rhizobiales bacterium]|nr:ABC transporter substrate-binding protein [Hyphomicrobiales bacterium]MBA68446.1 ABC transporter substrate-binding protein [Hyphomicrobiales bacterium]|tara:strand:- start:1988 stop:2881 length:894 start_codon:yes stop_codon:yes gene_type:complete